MTLFVIGIEFPKFSPVYYTTDREKASEIAATVGSDPGTGLCSVRMITDSELVLTDAYLEKKKRFDVDIRGSHIFVYLRGFAKEGDSCGVTGDIEESIPGYSFRFMVIARTRSEVEKLASEAVKSNFWP